MTGFAGCDPCCRCGCCGFRIQEHDEVSSTNELVKTAIEQGGPEGLVVCARSQTGGYGRQGRSWASPEGGLYMSLLLRPDRYLPYLPTLSLVVGLAVRRALVKLVGAEAPDTAADISNSATHMPDMPAQSAMQSAIKVKWPNDVVYSVCPNGTGESEALQTSPPISPNRHDSLPTQHDLAKPFKKLCGISLEQHAGGICVGIGVNVRRPCGTQAAHPVGGKNTAVYLADLGAPDDVAVIRDAILRELADMYPHWREAGFGPFLDEYNAAGALQDREVVVERMDGSTIAAGRVVQVDATGQLIVAVEREDGSVEEKAVSSGEAHVRA